MRSQHRPHTQPDAFNDALRLWLSGDMSGHLGPYMYTDDTDDHRWKDGHSANTYYLGKDDKATFDLMIRDLSLTVDGLFDLGPGGEAAVIAKSIPIVRTTKASHYFPVDLSRSYAKAAAQFVNKTCGISSMPVIIDFYEEFPVAKLNSLIALMGGTLANFETHGSAPSLQIRLIDIFSHYRRAITKYGYFLVSFDANENGSEIVSCYDNKEFGELVRGCVSRAINTEKFDYKVAWTPGNYQLATGLQSTSDQIIHFDNEQFPIEQGEFLSVLNSYRFPVEFVVSAAAAAGWSHIRAWSATGRVHYLLFKAD